MLKSLKDREGLAEEAHPATEDGMSKPAPSRSAGVVRAFAQLALMIVVLAVSAYLMESLVAQRPERTGRPQVSAAIPVEAVAATPAIERPRIRLYGEIEAARIVDLRPAVAGEVIWVNPALRAGLSVSEGDTLFRIDRFNYEGQLTEAEANLAQTEAAIVQGQARISAEQEQLTFSESQLELASADLTRARTLAETGALTTKQVEDRELIVSQREQAVSSRRSNLVIEQASLEQQLATRDRLRWRVRQAERDLRDTEVVAPFSGIVTRSDVELGRIVSASDATVSLYDGTALEARFTLTDAQYGRVAVDDDPLIGRDVDLIWTVGGIDYSYRAQVVRIGAEIASARGGVDVFARLVPDNADVNIRPGAFVEVSVPDRRYVDAFRLPETALYDASAVYVIVDGVLKRRTVTVAAYDSADVIVTEGLVAGETVLVTRLSRIEDGLKVSVPSGVSGQPAQ
ncbi:efflux RND transporter periplasmic adaptor subunit [Oricola sp.]|uniref:efflux RND transporter periplasmic adaptor subunit n=1 Tax=Oricola sp. TaxID=1979950 RepID=UPI003BA85575